MLFGLIYPHTPKLGTNLKETGKLSVCNYMTSHLVSALSLTKKKRWKIWAEVPLHLYSCKRSLSRTRNAWPSLCLPARWCGACLRAHGIPGIILDKFIDISILFKFLQLRRQIVIQYPILWMKKQGWRGPTTCADSHSCGQWAGLQEWRPQTSHSWARAFAPCPYIPQGWGRPWILPRIILDLTVGQIRLQVNWMSWYHPVFVALCRLANLWVITFVCFKFSRNKFLCTIVNFRNTENSNPPGPNLLPSTSCSCMFTWVFRVLAIFKNTYSEFSDNPSYLLTCTYFFF